jgi:hypothetical protein
MTYYIYHIPGVKIGCSIEPRPRIKRQGYSNFEILEEHTDIYVASNREKELQKQFGYQTDDTLYWMTIKIATFESSSKGGKTGGKIGGSIGGKHTSPNGGKVGGKTTCGRVYTCDCGRVIKGISYFVHLKTCKKIPMLID